MPRAAEFRALVRVFGYLRGHRLGVALGLVVTLAASLLSAVPPLLMRSVVDDAIPGRRWRLLAFLTLGLALVPLARLGLGVLQTRWINGAAQQIARQLRVELVAHLLRLPIAFYDANKTRRPRSRSVMRCGRRNWRRRSRACRAGTRR